MITTKMGWFKLQCESDFLNRGDTNWILGDDEIKEILKQLKGSLVCCDNHSLASVTAQIIDIIYVGDGRFNLETNILDTPLGKFHQQFTLEERNQMFEFQFEMMGEVVDYKVRNIQPNSIKLLIVKKQ